MSQPTSRSPAQPIPGDWGSLRRAARVAWPELGDNELAAVDGRLEALEGLLMERYALSAEEAATKVRDWLATVQKPV